MRLSSLLALLAFGLCALPALAAPDGTFNFTVPANDDAQIAELTPSAARIERAGEALRIEFARGQWPNLRWFAPAPADWSGRVLTLDVENVSPAPVEIGVRADDDANADGWRHSWTGRATLAPGQRKRVALEFDNDPMSVGMRALPPLAPLAFDKNVTVMRGQGAGKINASNIVSWQLFLHNVEAPTPLVLHGVALLPGRAGDLSGIVDEFGQFSGRDWLLKMRDAGEFATRVEAEAADLKAHPAPPDRDEFGGWKSGPQLRATGYFRSEKVGEKWGLVTPTGHLFWSLGVDTVTPWNATILSDREAMFVSLPAPGSELAQFRKTIGGIHMGPRVGLQSEVFDFGAANLYRKYGPDYFARWADSALRRLPSWGFNTVGNWSDPALHDAEKRATRVPFVGTVHIGGDHPRLSGGDDYWGQMHDPFDPQFALDAAASLGNVAKGIGDDPYCVGYFVDNELSWGGSDENNPRQRYGLAYGALKAPKSAARAAFIAQLQTKYGTSEKLAATWQIAPASWDDLRAPDAPNNAAKADFSAFLSAFADKYFVVVREELKKVAPHQMYLGCRFAWRTPEAVASAARVVDVLSFNIYQPTVGVGEFRDLDKPFLIGEFHMGATDRGSLHPGLVEAPDQIARAQMFAAYLQSALDAPNCVGAHWFQYADEPVTGRQFDGENYNIGLVDITDTPYPELIAASRQIGAQIYARHGKN